MRLLAASLVTLIVAGALAACTNGTRATATTESGTLAEGDTVLIGGEFGDVFTVRASAGQWIRASLTSTEFDPYLILIAPDGHQAENDDAEQGDHEHAAVVYQVTETGTTGSSRRPTRRGRPGRTR